MPTNKNRGPQYPTPLMQRWLDKCQRALATADADGAADHQVAWIVGAYFEALHAALGRTTDPATLDRLCMDEAARFLAILRSVPERRTRIAQERAKTLRQAGLMVFPTLTPEDDR